MLTDRPTFVRRRTTRPGTALTLLAGALSLFALPLAAQSEGAGERLAGKPELPPGPPIEGFEQLLPRGGIPALVDPEFVTAGDAELPDDAWVLGFELAGEAYAYDLNLMNHHEVVNHRAGDRAIAAVW